MILDLVYRGIIVHKGVRLIIYQLKNIMSRRTDDFSSSYWFSSAGHATILLRQRDHVCRPQNCYLLHYVVCSLWLLHLDAETLNIVCVPKSKALLRCRVVVVAKVKY